MVSELLPQHGTNANKRQLVAGGGAALYRKLCAGIQDSSCILELMHALQCIACAYLRLTLSAVVI